MAFEADTVLCFHNCYNKSYEIKLKHGWQQTQLELKLSNFIQFPCYENFRQIEDFDYKTPIALAFYKNEPKGYSDYLKKHPFEAFDSILSNNRLNELEDFLCEIKVSKEILNVMIEYAISNDIPEAIVILTQYKSTNKMYDDKHDYLFL